GAAHRIRDRLGSLPASAETDTAEQTADASRRALGEEDWSALFDEGAALSVEEAVAYALEDGRISGIEAAPYRR
ncbi:MAG TPA: hypothetical protein PKA95_17825, partial [Thermomicrobiales bacterium]|nr:hypothetical protein [Thermomicrobiales bacterium]